MDVYMSIDKLYEKAGYLAKYGGDLYLAIILIIVVFCVVSYFYVMSKVRPIRDNWVKERCNPQVIPFAGMIYKRDDQSTMEATAENFTYCTQNVLVGISDFALQPIRYSVSAMTNVFGALSQSMNAVRGMFSSIRGNVGEITEDTMGRTLNIMTPFQQMMIGVKSAFGKVSGIGTASIYTLYGIYMGLKALIGSVIQFLIVILVALVALMIVLWVMPWTIPVAAILSGIVAVMAAMVTAVIIISTRTFKGSGPNIPKKLRKFFK